MCLFLDTDMSLRVRVFGKMDAIPAAINPVTFFENMTAEFTCLCL